MSHPFFFPFLGPYPCIVNTPFYLTELSIHSRRKEVQRKLYSAPAYLSATEGLVDGNQIAQTYSSQIRADTFESGTQIWHLQFPGQLVGNIIYRGHTQDSILVSHVWFVFTLVLHLNPSFARKSLNFYWETVLRLSYVSTELVLRWCVK